MSKRTQLNEGGRGRGGDGEEIVAVGQPPPLPHVQRVSKGGSGLGIAAHYVRLRLLLPVCFAGKPERNWAVRITSPGPNPAKAQASNVSAPPTAVPSRVFQDAEGVVFFSLPFSSTEMSPSRELDPRVISLGEAERPALTFVRYGGFPCLRVLLLLLNFTHTYTHEVLRLASGRVEAPDVSRLAVVMVS
ncbi:hypothetical protein LY76DRAFT_257672 [Colletotrichum caudatum]|nr:hypothetical protein LY76DRAFT_257672 [Colletotrichum caudatum]